MPGPVWLYRGIECLECRRGPARSFDFRARGWYRYACGRCGRTLVCGAGTGSALALLGGGLYSLNDMTFRCHAVIVREPEARRELPARGAPAVVEGTRL